MSFINILCEASLEASLKRKYPSVIFQLIGPTLAPQDDKFYRLQMLVVPFKLREQKLGTKFMKELLKTTDADIFLTPDNSYQEPDGMSKKELIDWYKKLGFQKKKNDFRSQDTYVFYKDK